LALFYGGVVQLLAGMWEFKTGNTFGALVFSSYGGFWMSYAALFIVSFGFLDGYETASEDDLNNGLGIYLLCWTIFSFLMFVASHRTTLLLFSLFFIVTITFLMLTIGRFCDNDLRLQRAGGYFGIVAALMAWYGCLAALLTTKNSFFTLPVGEMDPIYIKIGWLEAEPKDHSK
jgi:succinate-acetate transporter protein